MCTALYDQFAVLRRHKSLITVGVCGFLYACGLVLCTRAGIFYFEIFDDYSYEKFVLISIFIFFNSFYSHFSPNILLFFDN
jgi:hypothetical protein